MIRMIKVSYVSAMISFRKKKKPIFEIIKRFGTIESFYRSLKKIEKCLKRHFMNLLCFKNTSKSNFFES